MSSKDKDFAVSLVVSCKDMACGEVDDACNTCIETVVAGNLKKYEGFRVSHITTANGSRQFNVSMDLTCRKPDCTGDVPRAVACCTASSDKCEMCLATVVSKDIREMRAFNVKEIVVV